MKQKFTCEFCGKEYSSYLLNSKYCSLNCKSSSMIADIDFSKVVSMYENGMSQCEIAAELKTTQKVIYNYLKRINYKCRKAAARNQQKEHNNNWKENDVTYSALHYRVEVKKGKPNYCSICGKTDTNIRYEWACTGNYYNTNDYVRMCVNCHKNYDKNRKGVSKNVKRNNK